MQASVLISQIPQRCCSCAERRIFFLWQTVDLLVDDFCYYMLCYLHTLGFFIQVKQPALVRRLMSSD